MVVAVNKMDLVGYAESVYDDIVGDFGEFAARLTLKDITYIPISALEGDNVVDPSPRMPWYQGGPLLRKLETVTVGARINSIDFRFPVQVRHSSRTRHSGGTQARPSQGRSRRERMWSCCRPAWRRVSSRSRPSTDRGTLPKWERPSC
jgi:sulfate adenylyltransferase subunit 1 (EFTu-like GTPase family)